jgi:hypothetical protein
MIRAQAIRDRLQAFCLDEADPRTGKKVEMNTAQIKAATTLLNKVLPDLQSIDSTVETREAPRNEQEIHAELETAMQALTPQDQAKLQQLLGQVPHDVH